MKTLRVQSIDVTKASAAEEMTRDEALGAHAALSNSPEHNRLWCSDTDVNLSIADRRANFDADDSRGPPFDLQRRSRTLVENTKSAMSRTVSKTYAGMNTKKHKKQEEILLLQSAAAATVLVWLNNYDFSDKTSMTYADAVHDYWPCCPNNRQKFDQLLRDAAASTLLHKDCLAFIPGSASPKCKPVTTSKKRSSGGKKAQSTTQTNKRSKKAKAEKEAKPKFDEEQFEQLEDGFDKDAYLATLEQRGRKPEAWDNYLKTGRFDPFLYFFKSFFKTRQVGPSDAAGGNEPEAEPAPHEPCRRRAPARGGVVVRPLDRHNRADAEGA